MFRTNKLKLLLGLYVFLLLSIPVGAYLASEAQNPNVSAKKIGDRTITNVEPSPNTTGLAQLINDITNPSPSPSSEPTMADSFGPILDFTLLLEGRPSTSQGAKVFVGIAEGEIKNSPTYLLSFTINLPDDGKYPNLSLAGLTAGSRYSAYLKGPSQIATASAFTMSAFTTHLNNSLSLTGLSGDLNDDNVIDENDQTIAKAVLGLRKGSTGFNDNADFNRDGVINTTDLGFITKNLNKIGASGRWTSPPPATQSGSLGISTGGYWIWMPEID